MKKFLKAKWKSVSITLVMIFLWSISIFFSPIKTQTYVLLLIIYAVSAIKAHISDYENEKVRAIERKRQRILDEEMIDIIENLAIEIVYPEQTTRWKKTLLSRVSQLKKAYLK